MTLKPFKNVAGVKPLYAGNDSHYPPDSNRSMLLSGTPAENQDSLRKLLISKMASWYDEHDLAEMLVKRMTDEECNNILEKEFHYEVNT